MSEEIKMNLGSSLVLAEVTKMLLYKKVKNDKGEDVLVDRDLPFRLRYYLNKDKILFDRDVQRFNRDRLLILAKYGEPDDSGDNVVIKDNEKMELFKKEINDLIDLEITHPISKLSVEDIDLVKDTDLLIKPEVMNVFIHYLVDDPDLAAQTEIGFDIKDLGEVK